MRKALLDALLTTQTVAAFNANPSSLLLFHSTAQVRLEKPKNYSFENLEEGLVEESGGHFLKKIKFLYYKDRS